MLSCTFPHPRASLLAAALALAALAPAHAGRVHVSGLEAGERYQRLIVRFKHAVGGRAIGAAGVAAIDAALARVAADPAWTAAPERRRVALRRVRRMATGADVIGTGRPLDAAETRALLERIAADPTVEWAQPDYLVQALAVPNDPRLGEQWNLADSAAGLRMPRAWDAATGAGVVVAVVDSGVRPHPDLNANVLPGYDFVSSTTGFAADQCRAGIAGCGRSEDGDGRDPDPTDVSWATTGAHGTHVAGIVAAVADNALGVAGVAHGAKVVPVRALGRAGSGATSDIADAIVWASGGAVAGVPANPHPADVINLSLGRDLPCAQTPAYQSAIDAAAANGAVVVASAGNSNIDAAGASPASCEGVIAVAASDAAGNRAFYSSYGASIDIAAPGGETCSPPTEFLPLGAAPGDCSQPQPGQGIVSTVFGSGYGFQHGTSMAAPHVAGVVALIQAASATSRSAAQVRQILAATARPIAAAQCPGGCGAGLVDAAAAVAAAAAQP